MIRPPSRLRVAFFVKNYPATYETFIETQLRGLLQNDVDVDVIAFRSQIDSARRDSTSNVRYCASVPSNRLARVAKSVALAVRCGVAGGRGAAQRAARLLNARLSYQAWPFRLKRDYDIVHCQFATSGLIAVRLREIGLLRGKIVTAVRGHDMNRIMHETAATREQLFAETDLFLPVCGYLRDQLVQAGCEPQKTLVHRSGLDVDRVRAAGEQATHAGERLVIFVGRLTDKKGPHVAVDAIRLVQQIHPDVTLEIVGDGPLRQPLEQQVRQLQLQNIVRFIGRLDHQQTLQRIASATALVLPCQTAADGCEEGIPNVLKEAMLLGVPVVTTRHAGIPELVRHQESGYLSEPGDVTSVAEHLASVLDDPPSAREKASPAVTEVARDYDGGRLVDQLVEIYRRTAS